MKPPKETTNSVLTATWWSRPGIVYFFGVGSPPVAIKIGMAAAHPDLNSAIRRRFQEIQTHNHERVELLGLLYIADGDRPTRQAEVIERRLHLRFGAHQRAKSYQRGAEWFDAVPDLLEYIASNTQPPEALNVPRFLYR